MHAHVERRTTDEELITVLVKFHPNVHVQLKSRLMAFAMTMLLSTRLFSYCNPFCILFLSSQRTSSSCASVSYPSVCLLSNE